MPQRVAQSSHLQSYSYDANTETLTVQFQNGTIYQYTGVPQTEYWNLAQNGGAGTYFWAKIRNNYPTQKIFDPRAK
jgi:hypothetical protein